MSLSYALDLRPRALKNSRESRGSYTAVNKLAKARLEAARSLLRLQHGPELLTGRYDLTVRCYYSDRRSWLDTDGVATWVMEALQTSVLPDDGPKHIRDVTVRPRLSRVKVDRVELELMEVLT